MDPNEQLARALHHLAELEHERREIISSLEVMDEALLHPDASQRIPQVRREILRLRKRMGRV